MPIESAADSIERTMRQEHLWAARSSAMAQMSTTKKKQMFDLICLSINRIIFGHNLEIALYWTFSFFVSLARAHSNSCSIICAPFDHTCQQERT